ncbi:protein rolling stone-like [Biomphalaria glabrata]|uniref:Protein rolling stone-like n=1 Tax=Biomphalaria glabrata TaxID=6526 RepID=A0A9W3A2L5_BIOGL|nr:protein rolling stone-like [Biomphalaria glabrata]
MVLSLRKEFRVKNFGFQDVHIGRFCTFQWRLPGSIFLIYRIVIAIYVIVWLSLTANDSSGGFLGSLSWGAFLTNWTYILLTLYFTYYAVLTIIVYLARWRSPRNLFRRQQSSEHWQLFSEMSANGYEEVPSDGEVSAVTTYTRSPVPWYYAIVWILLNAASVGAIMVSLVFWAILVPGSNLGQMTNSNIQLHLINSVLILIEHAVIAIPIRLLHVIYPLIYGVIYVFFSVFYWVDDHSHVMYEILNWNNPGPTIGFVILIGFVIIPIIHILIYCLYRLKMNIFHRYC